MLGAQFLQRFELLSLLAAGVVIVALEEHHVVHARPVGDLIGVAQVLQVSADHAEVPAQTGLWPQLSADGLGFAGEPGDVVQGAEVERRGEPHVELAT